MGRVILCETQEAKTSYIFPNTKVEVFSYEELCFYIYNNIALILEEYISTPMFNWIEEELGLLDLARELRVKKEKEGNDLTDLLAAILTYREYYTMDEVKEFILQLERMKNLSTAQFRKLQADGFLRYHKYLKAISIYDEILENNPEIPKDDFYGALYHNKAVALSYNFEFVEAAKCYMMAYEITKNKKSIYGYLFLEANMRTKEEVAVLAKRYQVEDLLITIYDDIEDAQTDVVGSPMYHCMQKAVYHYDKKNMVDYDRRMEHVLYEIKEEFRNQAV